jgi:hypothetical protein
MSIRLEKTQSAYQVFQRWCMSPPVPAKLLVDTPDGEKVLVVDPQQTRPWSKLLNALISMGAVSIEAQNEKGEVLRRQDVTLPPEVDDPEDAGAFRHVELPMPASEDARMLGLFANLLAGAYRNGAESQRQSSDAAFKMLVSLAESAFRRLDTVERALVRARVGAPEEAQPASGGAGDLMALVSQFMQGAQMAAAQKASAPVTNGVHVPSEPEEAEEEEEAD